MARDAIKQAGQVVIVEGYVDAVIAHQYGTKQTVACIGSAITEKHIQQLKKLTKQVTLALDPDAAGSAATEHGIQEALKGFDRTVVPVPVATGAGYKTEGKQGRGNRQQQPQSIIRLEEQVDADINVLQLPDGEDPDEVIRRDFSAWFYAVSHPLPLVDYYFVVKTSGLDLREPRGKTEAAKRLLPVIATISDRIKRDAYMRKLATIISIDERLLYEELQQVLRNHKSTSVNAAFSAPTGQRATKAAEIHGEQAGQEPAWVHDGSEVHKTDAARQEIRLDRKKADKVQWEDYLIGLLLQNPGLSLHICAIITDSDFAGTDTRELYRILNSLEQRGSSPFHQLIEQNVPAVLLPTVNRAQKCVESRLPKDGVGLVKEAVQCATRLKRTRLLQLNTELQYLIREAFASGDSAAIRQLQPRLMEIYQQLRTLNAGMPLHG